MSEVTVGVLVRDIYEQAYGEPPDDEFAAATVQYILADSGSRGEDSDGQFTQVVVQAIARIDAGQDVTAAVQQAVKEASQH
jgi:hypothetical protein